MGKSIQLLIAAWAAVFFSGCGEEEVPPEPVIRPVRYQEVFATGGERMRSFSGTAQAPLESKLSFKVSGTISRLPVKVGDRVRVGGLIAALDPKDFELTVQEAEAALASAQAQSRNAAANYNRVRALYENGNAAKSALDQARAGDESAREQVKSVQKRVELAQLQLSYARLEAPAAGEISQVRVELNENVGPGQAVVVLTSGERLEVEVAVPEGLIAQVREGMAVSINFDAIPNRSFGARVTEVGGSTTGMATTFPVIARLDKVEADMRPGMAAEVTFRFGGGGRERIYLPPVAVGENRQGQRFVFVVEPTEEGLGTARRRLVEVGEIDSRGMEILEGLEEGERVVTAGVSRIADGQEVRLLAAEGA